MLNKTQEEILKTRAKYLKLQEKNDLIENFLSALEKKLNIKIDRNESSNFYILADFFVEMGLDAYNIVSLINLEMLKFFDSNKFDGYLGSDYLGCRQALMQLGYFLDVKFYSNFTGAELGQVQTVFLAKDLATAEALKSDSFTQNKIAAEMLAIYPVGTVSYKKDVGFIDVKITASTGQELLYSYYIAEPQPLGLWVEYYIDYEDFDRKIDYSEDIKAAIFDLFNQKYGFIGKDFIINDFRGIIKEIGGLKDIKFYNIVNGVKVNEIVDNITIDNLKVLQIADIKVSEV